MYEYIDRFKKLGFGMFVHFGLYSVLGKGEWARKICKIENAEYDNLINKFDVKKDWAKKLVSAAKAGGCKYIVLTTRHHDGFSLYDTQGLNDFDAPHSPCKRDLVREFVDECNKAGIVPFFYHTLLDWHVPEYNDDFPKYIDYLVKSIEILCSSYGKIGGLWFDGMWDKPNEDWQEDRIYSTIRKYQPEAMIINNTGLSAQGKTGHKEIDSVTFERGKPAALDCGDKPVAGESCDGINDHWGYAENDICTKSVPTLIEHLLDCRACNCNFLLNLGPMGNGYLKPIEKCELLEIGKWIKINKKFIYNAHSCDVSATNARVLSDDKYYYAVMDKVPMAADPNVAAFSGDLSAVMLNTGKKILSATWLDNGEAADVSGNKINVRPFEYGTSLSSRVVRFKLK